MANILQDIRFGFRMLRKTPVVSCVAALSIGVGVVAVVMGVAMAKGLLWQPFPYQDQDRIAMVLEATRFTSETPAAPANFLAWREAAESVESLEAWSTDVANLSGLDQPEEVHYGGVTVGLLRTLGRQPALGRGFRPEEGRPGSNDVVILDHGFWQSRFDGGDVLGRTLDLDGVPHTVVGIMPDDFELLPANLDLYRPLTPERDDWERSLMVVGRLAPGRTVEQLRSELAAATSALRSNHPTNENLRAQVRPLRGFFPGATDTRLIEIFLLVGGFVLVIAAANVAGLLLARAQGRNREIAVRSALGAPRRRIVVQLLTEAVTLALIGAAVGIIGSLFAVRGMAAAMPPEMPEAFMPRIDTVVLLITLAVAVAAGLLFGASPALHALRSDLRGSLTETGRDGTGGRGRTRARSAFVVAELAVALALLTGAGLLVRTFDRIVNSEPGFRADHMLTMRITLPEQRYPDSAAVTRFHDRLAERLAAVPGVEGVALMNTLPRSRSAGFARFATREQLEMAREEQPVAVWQPTSPSFFQVMEGSILRGRGIRDTDRAATTPVVVINQRLAERYFPDDDPIGRPLRVRETDRQIVGIAADMLLSRVGEVTGTEPAVFVPFAQVPPRSFYAALRTTGQPTTLTPQVRAAVAEIDPDLPLGAVRSLPEHIRLELAAPRMLAIALLAFAALALALAAIGIYGLIAYSVAQRRRELAIRMALGASASRLLALILCQGARLAALGLLIGAPLAWGMARLAASMEFLRGTVRAGTLFFALIGVLLLAVALVATLVPATRAARTPPAQALR